MYGLGTHTFAEYTEQQEDHSGLAEALAQQEIWKCYQSTSKARAKVLQNLNVWRSLP